MDEICFKYKDTIERYLDEFQRNRFYFDTKKNIPLMLETNYIGNLEKADESQFMIVEVGDDEWDINDPFGCLDMF